MSEDLPFAIYRQKKLKSMGIVGASARHMTREAKTPNADPDRAHLNRVLIGGEDPYADVEALVPSLDAVDEKGLRCRRSNSVVAIEVLLTTSPEWWETSTPEQQEEWLERSVLWLIAEYGEKNIAHLRLHGDEQTPHLTGFIVPLDERGHLNARKWVGGGARCAQQQTDYALAVEHLGLRRGIEGSEAKHERVRRHYAQISESLTPLTIKTPPHILTNPKKWTQDEAQKLAEKLAPLRERALARDSAVTTAKAAKATAAKASGRAERAEAALAAQKLIADRMRSLHLPDVLEALGFQQDPKERDRWRAEGFNITVGTGAKASKWFDHLAGKGRGGAIDLTQHVLGCDFKEALAWLSDRFGESAAAAEYTAALHKAAIREVKAAVAECQPFTPPRPAPEHWPQVKDYLVQERALPAPYIERLHELGDCYADARRNAVFVCRDDVGHVVGAELKGTVKREDGSRFTGMAPGSKKEKGGFRIGQITRAAVVYLVESAIDALSLARLRQLAGEKEFAIISSAGVSPEPRHWFANLADTVKRVCAFDNDEAGDKAAKALRRNGFQRLRPENKDWNDDLRAHTTAVGSAAAAAKTPEAAPGVAAGRNGPAGPEQ